MPTDARRSTTQEAISRLGAGDHLCCIYRDRGEQMGIVVPYLVHGLHSNNKCLYIIDESTREDVFHAFAEAGVDLTTHIASGQFLLLTKAESYLKEGSFDPDRMIATLKLAEANAIDEGYAGLRITGEMTWVFSGLPGVEGLIEYESKLNLFFPNSKSTAICQYHESRFDPDILIDVLHTHPAVVIYGEVCENPYYIPPDEFLLRLKSSKIPLALYQRVRDDIMARAGLEVDRQRLESELKGSLDRSERTRRALLSALEDQKRTVESLKRYGAMIGNLAEGVYLVGLDDGIIKYVNPRFGKMFGYDEGELEGKDVSVVNAPTTLSPEETSRDVISMLRQTGEWQGEIENVKKDGTRFWCYANVTLFDDPALGRVCISVHTDITGRKQAEAYREMRREVLELLNEPGDLQVAMQRVIAIVKKGAGCDAVGLRLQDGEDFPYCAHQGFSREFLLTENTLLERDAGGGVCRDKDGNVSLECTCGLVISGKANAASSMFTKGGSFWTNDSFPLLELPTDKDPRHHPRNQCIHQGYASVALVPIRNQERIVGLLHLNDRRKGRFSIETIELLEGITEHIGAAMMRKRAEDALRASEQEFRSLAESMPQIVWVTRADGWNIYFSQQWVDYTGLTLEQSHGHGWNTPFHPDDKQRAWDAWQRATQHNDIYSVECRLRRADGAYRWWLIRGVPLHNATGEILKWFGTCTDIDDIKRAQGELLDAKAIVESVVENMPFMLFLKEATDLRFVMFNRAGEELLGYDRKALLGKNNLDLFPPEQAAHFMDKDREVLDGETGILDIPEEAILTAKKGERLLHTRKVCIRGPDGTTKYLLGISEDITERKLAEAEHEKLQVQFTQAQKMESVGQLAGGVAHDFNNLLMGIMGYTQLCLDEVGPDHPIRGWLDEINKEAERSAHLTHQLLAFARKQTIAPKVLDINSSIESMLKLLRRLIGEDIKVRWTPTSGAWPVKMDPVQIDQILANLAVNARDAIGGVGLISIETGNATLDQPYCSEHVGSEPGDYVLLTVSDTGCGMDRETLGHIFEPFFTTKGVGEGTGLGLATVYGIVKQNNGFINVHSEPGKGTSFKIYLPRFVAPEAVAVAAETPTRPPRGSETVLLVEDEKSIRITTQVFLEDLGYTVLVAEGPEKALLLASEHPGEIHMLVTDVIMPGMSGRDMAQRLMELRPALKCLFISGFTADVIARRGILDDGVNFLAKPFGRDALARKAREVLDGQKTARTPHAPNGD